MASPQAMTTKTVSCISVSNEVMDGTYADLNSRHIARLCKERGVQFKSPTAAWNTVESIIGELAMRINAADIIFVGGGIGPSPEDVTYKAIAGFFGIDMKKHEETWEYMLTRSKKCIANPNFNWNGSSPEAEFKQKMAVLPTNLKNPDAVQVVFPFDDEWTPSVTVNKKIVIVPGEPSMFQRWTTEYMDKELGWKKSDATAEVTIYTYQSEGIYSIEMEKLNTKHESQGVKSYSSPSHHTGEISKIIVRGPSTCNLKEIAANLVASVEGAFSFKEWKAMMAGKPEYNGIVEKLPTA